MKLTLLQHMNIMADRAIDIIQKETVNFVAKVKTGYDGADDDLVTTADVAAQDMYQAYIEEHFPNDGIIGEENLNKESLNGRYFTIDPLDGTKAFGRRQSSGVGTMIAHVNEEGIVDAAVVGDINTRELYFFGPDKVPTRRRFGVESEIVKISDHKLNDVYALLRRHPEEYPRPIQDIVNNTKGGIFKGLSVESGSIGTVLARLWKDEVQLVGIETGFNTPWDNTPCQGIIQQLDIIHLTIDPATYEIQTVGPELHTKIAKREYPGIMFRKQYLPEIMTWIEEWKAKNA